MAYFINGTILTLENPGECFTSMQVSEDRIVALGYTNAQELKNVDEEIIDLKGKTILPGFYDSHLHLISTFLNEISINFDHAKSIGDVQEIIDQWPYKYDYPVAIGKRLSEFNLKERRLPTRVELDRVSADFPLVISSIEFHTVLMNSYALNQFRIPFINHGFEKDGNKNFTGKLINQAAFIALKKVYDRLEDKHYLEGADKTFETAIKNGVTTMVAVEGGPLFHTRHPEIILQNKKIFPIDIEVFYSTTDLKKVLKHDLPRVGGDLFLDGSFRSRNAALYEPYNDTKDNLGKLFYTEQGLIEFIEHAHDLNLQIAIHAVGPRAIDRLLFAFETVLQKKINPNHRHRIEHFELPLTEHIQKAKELGITLAMHPTYEYFFREKGMMYDTRLGEERAAMTNPFRQIFDAGIRVAGCSDSDIMPINPMLGIHSAVNHPNPKSRITVYEAIQMYTLNGAYAIFQDEEKGSLKAGKKADFIILEQNPLEVDPTTLKDITIHSTYKNGKCLFTLQHNR
ncbi:amidohydrolase [Anaerovorax sp. IOR16]|uniref:amidohydrolase n=1 Tax=Anaerovorax sp. IOR16 TaxID=2773458 RepID=UPI0019D204E5|nr:amidohydrolase [Anaerovorax sp. IOR16]